MIKKTLATVILATSVLVGCVSAPPMQDLTAYKAHMPKSILVLPPINNTPDVKATYGYWTTTTFPIAEAGYYVFPIALVDRMFKENGVSNSNDAQSISPAKLQEIFGADAALYITVTQYGTKYRVIDSVSSVAAEAKLIDLKTGQKLWEGKQAVVQSSSQGASDPFSMLIGAIINQVANSVTDQAHNISNTTNFLLFAPAGKVALPGPIPKQSLGLLPGPRSPNFGKDSAR